VDLQPIAIAACNPNSTGLHSHQVGVGSFQAAGNTQNHRNACVLCMLPNRSIRSHPFHSRQLAPQRRTSNALQRGSAGLHFFFPFLPASMASWRDSRKKE
jgi:hypothetical protein